MAKKKKGTKKKKKKTEMIPVKAQPKAKYLKPVYYKGNTIFVSKFTRNKAGFRSLKEEVFTATILKGKHTDPSALNNFSIPRKILYEGKSKDEIVKRAKNIIDKSKLKPHSVISQPIMFLGERRKR